MISDQPVNARIVDTGILADMLTAALRERPGIIRLEPTLRSTLTRLRDSPVHNLQKITRSGGTDSAGYTDSTARDGLRITISSGVVDLQVDVATDIAHCAVDAAEDAQTCAAQTIRKAGLTAGTIDVAILSIEGDRSRAIP